MNKFYTVSFVDVYEDHRGAVVYPFRDVGVDPGDMRDMHFATIVPGEVRGNHSHASHTEYILVTGAEVTAAFVSPDGLEDTITLGPEPALVTIHPGAFHAFRNDGEFPCFLTCWYSGAGEIKTERRRILD